MRVLSDLTETKLVRALQSSHRDWCVREARARQVGIGREGGLVWTGGETTNILFPLVAARAAEETFTRALHRIRGSHVHCELGPACRPRNLKARLLGYGFTLPTHGLAGMACELRDVGATKMGPPELRVEAVSDFSGCDRHPFYSGTEWQDVAIAMATGQPQRVWHFLAWLDDLPVGAASLLFSAGVAGIYGVGVLPEYRRQGIGAEVTSAACRFAAGAGFKAAVLTSSPKGQSPYEHVGFRQICRVEACDLSPEAQQRKPLSTKEREVFVHVSDGRLARVRPLLDTHPQMIHLQNQSGVGLLDAAAYMHRSRMAEWLFERGAAMNPVTAYDLGWGDRIAAMARTDPDVISRRVGGLSPLHIAILRRDTGQITDMELVRILVECGADLSAIDDEHRSTPLGWAQAFDDEEAIEFLTGCGAA